MNEKEQALYGSSQGNYGFLIVSVKIKSKKVVAAKHGTRMGPTIVPSTKTHSYDKGKNYQVQIIHNDTNINVDGIHKNEQATNI